MSSPNVSRTPVPFFRPSLTDAETQEVLDTLRSGWLTTGEKVKRFERDFAAAIGCRHAIALNSCTAALHLGVEALGLQPGQAVLVPTMTFAATAEVVRYQGAIPILVDCDPTTLNLNIEDAARKLDQVRNGRAAGASKSISPDIRTVGIIAVHVGGMMMAIDQLQDFARRERLWIVDDAAHSFPAAWRRNSQTKWQRCGEGTADVSCFSFYANKTITTGEGGMAVTDNPDLAKRMRMMSLHGLSQDAWDRYSKGGTWDYKITAPGFKYNLTDIAGAIGIHQVARAESLRKARQDLAHRYLELLNDVNEIELPPTNVNRIHSWHLFPIKLHLNRLSIDRNTFVEELKRRGVGCSVHWRPLHLHPYYQQTFGWRAEDLPVASEVWQRLVSLPLFPGMDDHDVHHVVESVAEICERYSR